MWLDRGNYEHAVEVFVWQLFLNTEGVDRFCATFFARCTQQLKNQQETSGIFSHSIFSSHLVLDFMKEIHLTSIHLNFRIIFFSFVTISTLVSY